MSDSPPPSPNPRRRRSSFAELFAPRTTTTSSASPPTAPVPKPQHSRGVSVSNATLGGSSPTQSSPFTAFAKQRRASVSTSSGTGSPEFRNSFTDEAIVVEDAESAGVPMNTPVSPSFARRVSFGAQALRDVKGSTSGGSGGGGRRPSSSLFVVNENIAPSESAASPAGSSRTATTRGKGRGEGFNWSDALRDKTKRSPSFSSSANPFAANTARNRSTSVAATTEPPMEIPKAAAVPRRMQKPDQLGERMLRGEFMMD